MTELVFLVEEAPKGDIPLGLYVPQSSLRPTICPACARQSGTPSGAILIPETFPNSSDSN